VIAHVPFADECRFVSHSCKYVGKKTFPAGIGLSLSTPWATDLPVKIEARLGEQSEVVTKYFANAQLQRQAVGWGVFRNFGLPRNRKNRSGGRR
jgi:hypothetical protein